MPFIGRWQLGHVFNIAFLSTLFFAVVLLTSAAWHADHRSDEAAAYEEAVTEARGYPRQQNEARAHRQLVDLLASRMAAAERQRLVAEGAKLSLDAAVQLALSA